MQYISTRNTDQAVTASRAILQGISPEGGLFVPREIPRLDGSALLALCGDDYRALARTVLGKFLDGFTGGEVADCVESAYSGGRFEQDLPAPLAKIGEDTFALELWHGPTCAFKDIALQILPHLLTLSARKNNISDEIAVLVATSGDTGKAALEGFANVPGTRILVFYPADGVSEMQKWQMQSQEGENVSVCAIEGNFDDAQTGVKRIFTSPVMAERLAGARLRFSSANSINWGRLLPQVVYYFSAYAEMVRDEEVVFGDPVNFAVPTGNFGDILAAYYAWRMGLPVGRLICASNRNNVLADFIETGVYDRNRDFYPSLSPSMDILVSSNLERLLFELGGQNASAVRGLMDGLAREGRYTLPDDMRLRLRERFEGGFCDDPRTLATIRKVFGQYGYLLDPHTAVAWAVLEDYRARTGDDTKTVVVSTASAYKFADSVCGALDCSPAGGDPFAPMDALRQATGRPVPAPLEALRGKPPRLFDRCRKDGMEAYVSRRLGLPIGG